MRANPMWRLLLSAVAVTAFQSPQISVRTHALRAYSPLPRLALAQPLPHKSRRVATPPKAAAADGPPKAWDGAFRRRRLAIFACTVVAYSAYYLVRNSIYYTAPAMVAAPDLAIDITSIGVISSVFPLTYGCSKFVSGVVGDVLSPRIMLATGLALTASVNILFGLGTTLPWFVTLWAINGILQVSAQQHAARHIARSFIPLSHTSSFIASFFLPQGWGGPACAKLITAWFGARERGTYWGLWYARIARIPHTRTAPDRTHHISALTHKTHQPSFPSTY